MLFHKFSVKTIMSCWHRSMSRKHHFTSDLRNRFIESDSLFFHALTNRFKHRKSAMPFIQVKHSRSNAKSLQRAQAANA